MKSLNTYINDINESRTNPTQIAKLVKTWIMEAIPEYHELQLIDVFKSIQKGIEQGIHEYKKKFPEDEEVLDFLEEINSVIKTYTDWE